MRPILIDTSVIVAALDHRQHSHRAAVETLEKHDSPLATCEAVITEACHLLRQTPHGLDTVMANVDAGTFRTPFRLEGSTARVKSLMHQYRDIPASFADACLICLAEELQTGQILTLDSDFRIYRWARDCPFRLLIEI